MVNQIVISYEVKKGDKTVKRKVTMSGAVRAIRPAGAGDVIHTLAEAESKGLNVAPEDNTTLDSTEDGPLLCYEINGQMFCW